MLANGELPPEPPPRVKKSVVRAAPRVAIVRTVPVPVVRWSWPWSPQGGRGSGA